jgi:hypothetical protein
MHTDVWYELALRELIGEHGSAGELLRDAETAQAPGTAEREEDEEAEQVALTLCHCTSC